MYMTVNKYRIEYFNTVFKVTGSVEAESLEEAIETAKNTSRLFEIEDVRLYEMIEIDFN
jgi:hypothetical protein